ncbi:MAG: hypothetical protein NC110_08740 [Ruminococcus sp.]|nr:hypothetical protein [Ruminococcus sp.]
MLNLDLSIFEKEEEPKMSQEEIVGLVAMFVSLYRKFIEYIVSLFTK